VAAETIEDALNQLQAIEPNGRLRTMIGRYPVDRHFGRVLDEWKPLRNQGWDVEILLYQPDKSHVVCLAVKNAPIYKATR
jgi:hypothetical protein